MIGCILLGAAGVMLASRLLHRHHHGWHHHGRWAYCGSMRGGMGHGGGHWGHHGWGGHEGGAEGGFDDEAGFGGGPRWLHGRFGRGFVVRALADRLEATPAQEQVIRDAMDEFREAAVKLRGEGKRTRADIASAFRKGSFDEVQLGELYARHDRSLEDLRKAFVGMGARIHDALDEGQRARLADLIEAGPSAWRPRWGRGRGRWV
jgi:hypothetical protein